MELETGLETGEEEEGEGRFLGICWEGKGGRGVGGERKLGGFNAASFLARVILY